MNEKEMLERVEMAAKHFEAMSEAGQEAVEQFVRWMYALYGFQDPKGKK